VTLKTPRQFFLLLIILMLIFGALLGLGYWLKDTDHSEENWAMDRLTQPDNAELQSRINSKLFADKMVDLPGIGADIDNTIDESAMEAKLAGLTKNVTTEKIPTAPQLEGFYQLNKDNYREPSKLWLWVDTFSNARFGGQVFEKAQQALDTLAIESSTPEGDLFDRYGAILSTELDEKYGRAFTDKLLSLIADSESLPCWAGPISSPIGAHLVCVKEIDWGTYPAIDEIKSQLINDWRFSVATES
jgi:hypothetical protein